MNLKQYYHKFLREFIDKNWLQSYPNAIVLGERFIGHYYIIVFQADEKE